MAYLHTSTNPTKKVVRPMKTYYPPKLRTHGSVESLTGIVGNDSGFDKLIINGSTVTQQDREEGDLGTSVNCEWFDSNLDEKNWTFIATTGFEDLCRDAREDWLEDGDLDNTYSID
jgi:hypothetical protein